MVWMLLLEGWIIWMVFCIGLSVILIIIVLRFGGFLSSLCLSVILGMVVIWLLR